VVKKYASKNPGSINPKTARTVTELTGLLKALAKYIEGRSRKAYFASRINSNIKT